MTDLPRITFKDVLLPGKAIPLDMLTTHFEAYLSWPKERRLSQFNGDVARELAMLDTLVTDVGANSKDGEDILRGLDKRVGTLRRCLAIQKLPDIAETIGAELKSGKREKTVLFVAHKNVMTELAELLREYQPVRLYKDTPPIKRKNILKRFQTRKACRVFIGMIGIPPADLTISHGVDFVESEWSQFEDNVQAVMSVHRLGQTKPVTVRFFAMEGSVDKRLQRLFRQKTKRAFEEFTADEPENIDPFAD